MAYAAGVDVGSTQTKAIVIDEKGKIVGRALIDTGSNVVTAAEKSFLAALEQGGIGESEVGYIVGTGYGRYKVTFGDTQITEISCHARGAVHMFPGTRTVLDMGGQDTKAIRVQPNGEVVDFTERSRESRRVRRQSPCRASRRLRRGREIRYVADRASRGEGDRARAPASRRRRRRRA